MGLHFELKEVEERQVLKILKKLKPKTSRGLDEISSEVLKLGAEVLCIPLTLIINISTNPFDYLFFSIGNFIKVCIYKSCLFDFDRHQPFETGRIKSRKHFDLNAFLLRLATLAYLVKKNMPG